MRMIKRGEGEVDVDVDVHHRDLGMPTVYVPREVQPSGQVPFSPLFYALLALYDS